MTENKKEKILISSKEAAALLNVSMPTFYQMAAMKGFPSLRAGKKILVSAEGLKTWVDQQYGNNVAP